MRYRPCGRVHRNPPVPQIDHRAHAGQVAGLGKVITHPDHAEQIGGLGIVFGWTVREFQFYARRARELRFDSHFLNFALKHNLPNARTE
jgi:hypothetical protein